MSDSSNRKSGGGVEFESVLSILCENAVDVLSKHDLKLRLEAAAIQKRPLRVKAGFDPSSPDIHLGHTILLRKLRLFQDLGHKVIFIIGDYTAMVGDPTGQSKTRPALSREQIEENAKTYQDQAFKILDKDPKKIEIVRNSLWLDGPNMFRIFFQKIGSTVTIDQLLERDDFDKRRKAHRPIAIRELIYPILQGYDSVMVKADIELGGTDQKFNLLMGRDLQSEFGQQPQIVMTFPLLIGLDGSNKMSKSLGNHIGILDSAKDMFGKIMSIPDGLIETYYDLLLFKKPEEKKVFIVQIKSDPRNAKAELAVKIAAQYYGQAQAEAELKSFNHVFRDKQNPESLEEIKVSKSEIWIVDLLKETKVTDSSNQARRLVEQGGVTIDGQKIMNSSYIVKLKNGSLIKAGKKSFFKVLL